MSRIKGKNTKPEIMVRRFIFSEGFRYKLHDKTLPGKPDIVLPKYKTIIEIRGCFWHGHKGCKYFILPKSNTNFWREKISNTVNRDIENDKLIRELGWQLIIIWECSLNRKSIKETLNPNLLRRIENNLF